MNRVRTCMSPRCKFKWLYDAGSISKQEFDKILRMEKQAASLDSAVKSKHIPSRANSESMVIERSPRHPKDELRSSSPTFNCFGRESFVFSGQRSLSQTLSPTSPQKSHSRQSLKGTNSQFQMLQKSLAQKDAALAQQQATIETLKDEKQEADLRCNVALQHVESYKSEIALLMSQIGN